MRKKLRYILLFVLASFSQASIGDELSRIINGECEGVPSWVVTKIITHESKTFNDGKVQAWPWVLNINGEGRYFSNFQDALIAALISHKRGARRLGVGLGQIEWRYHRQRFGDSFASALNPRNNVRAVCDILLEAKASPKVKSWEDAIAYYHRPVMDRLARQYANKVLDI